jgi:Ca2+-binding RTX toxin-like protein
MSTITGTAHDDLLIGTSNADSIDGKDGNDILKGRAGDDILLGGNGNEHVYGGTGDDHLFGGDGNDVLSGRSGTNFLDGGAGDDTVLFTDGIDHILGGVETLSFRKAAGPVSVDSTGDIYLNGEWHGDGADLVARVNGSPFNDQFIGFNEFHGRGETTASKAKTRKERSSAIPATIISASARTAAVSFSAGAATTHSRPAAARR